MKKTRKTELRESRIKKDGKLDPINEGSGRYSPKVRGKVRLPGRVAGTRTHIFSAAVLEG